MTQYSDEEIYAKHRDELVRYATALVGPSLAEDVFSTVVLRALSRRRLSDLDNPRAYLYRAVLNEARSQLRRQPMVPLPNEIGVVRDPELDPSIVSAVMQLPPQQRAATFLVYWADCSIDEASDLMGVRPGSVKRYLHDARRSLRGHLGSEERRS